MKFFQRISTILPRRVSTTVNNQFLHVSCRASSSAVARPASLYEVPNRHRSNAMELIAKVPPIEVAADIAMCDGGGGATGHPIEFIKLDRRAGPEPSTCKYCGLRYKLKPGHHGHH